MKTRLFVALLFVLVAVCTTKVEANCSGDECGCHIPYAECDSKCPPYPEPGWYECTRDCYRAYKQCAIACCGQFFVAAGSGAAEGPEQIHCSMPAVRGNGGIRVHPKPFVEGSIWLGSFVSTGAEDRPTLPLHRTADFVIRR